MKGGNKVKKRKYLFTFMSALLSFGILTGCGDDVDDNEPDPTEEPSEQQQENNEEQEEEQE